MAFKASDRRHHAVEFIRNPVSSYFHSQVFIFMRLSSLAPPRIAIFARKCDCHAMVNSLAIARIAISTRNLRLSSLRLYDFMVNHHPTPDHYPLALTDQRTPMITSPRETALGLLSSTKQSSSGSVNLHGAHFCGCTRMRLRTL